MVAVQLLLATPPSQAVKRKREVCENVAIENSPLKLPKKDLVTPELSSPARREHAPTDSLEKPQASIEQNDVENLENVSKGNLEIQQATNDVSGITSTQKLTEKLERNRQKELQRETARKEKEQKKEEERLRKEAEKKAKENERLRKLAEREQERQAKIAEKEAERQAKIAEKEAEKQAKKQKLEKEKQRKELLKEEERLKKLAEKEKKEKQKLEKKLAAEEEKIRAEEDRKKQEEAKERSQMKIMSFFQKKPISQKDSKDPDPIVVKKEPVSQVYDKMFLPFFKKTTAKMYQPLITVNEIAAKNKELEAMLAVETVDNKLGVNSVNLPAIFAKFSSFNPTEAKITTHTSPEEVVQVLNSSEATEDKLCQLLLGLGPVKYIQFYENSKPPYIGTWSSKSHCISFPLLEPLNTSLTGLDYDYDSDIDWNIDEDAEGEGEDIDNDEDEDDEDEDTSMMHDEDDFVDFDDGQKKKKFIGPLVSISIWNDGNDEEFFNKMAYVPVAPTVSFPIDPVGTVIAQTSSSPTKSKLDNGDSNPSKVVKNKTVVNTLTPQKPKIEDKQVLDDLKTFIQENNDFSIGTLVELAHKKIKSYTKVIIKRTIQDISIYNKKTGKWELRAEAVAKEPSGE